MFHPGSLSQIRPGCKVTGLRDDGDRVAGRSHNHKRPRFDRTDGQLKKRAEPEFLRRSGGHGAGVPSKNSALNLWQAQRLRVSLDFHDAASYIAVSVLKGDSLIYFSPGVSRFRCFHAVTCDFDRRETARGYGILAFLSVLRLILSCLMPDHPANLLIR